MLRAERRDRGSANETLLGLLDLSPIERKIISTPDARQQRLEELTDQVITVQFQDENKCLNYCQPDEVRYSHAVSSMSKQRAGIEHMPHVPKAG